MGSAFAVVKETQFAEAIMSIVYEAGDADTYPQTKTDPITLADST